MLIEIDTHVGVPLYRQIIDQVRRAVMTGLLREGEQLESVKGLAARLKINPMTISKAFSFLVQEGLVERRRGVGLFVANVDVDQRRQTKKRLLQEALENAASLAVQMDVPEEEAKEDFVAYLRSLQLQKESER
jgi:GntR family transcriptional regulator